MCGINVRTCKSDRKQVLYPRGFDLEGSISGGHGMAAGIDSQDIWNGEYSHHAMLYFSDYSVKGTFNPACYICNLALHIFATDYFTAPAARSSSRRVLQQPLPWGVFFAPGSVDSAVDESSCWEKAGAKDAGGKDLAGTIMNSVPPGDLHAARPGEPVPGDPARPGDGHAPHSHQQDFGRPPGFLRRAFWFLFVLVIAAVLLGAAAYYEHVFKPQMMAQFFQAPPPAPVENVIAETEDMPRHFESIGTMMAVHQVTISPELEGRVEKINFESGQWVKAGDVLVELDASTQRADLSTYQAQQRLASANLARTKELASKQYSSKQSVDQVQSELDQARAGIAKSQAIIDHMVVNAPFNGMLGIRQINLGQYLAPGTPIVTLTDLDTLFVDFSLPEQDRAELTIDQPVEFRVDAFPGQVFRGEIAAIDPQVDPNMRAVKVRAAVANTDHRLQPGMYARVRTILPPQPNVVTIPEPAVDYTVYGESVYRLTEVADKKDPQGKPVYKAEQTFVTLGERFDGKVAVLKGVNKGDRVVVGGQLKLHNGAEVILSDQQSLQNPSEVPKE